MSKKDKQGQQPEAGGMFRNFKTATQELFSGKIRTDETPMAEPQVEVPEIEAEPQENPEQQNGQTFIPDTAVHLPPRIETEPEEELQTIITEDVVVEGSVTARVNVRNAGTIHGNLTSGKDIISSGIVTGNVSGSNIMLRDGATTIGDMAARNSSILSQDSIVIGNVDADHMDINGKIQGNLRSSHSIYLRSNAIVFGDITAQTFMVAEGTILKGNVNIAAASVDEGVLFNVADRVKRLQNG